MAAIRLVCAASESCVPTGLLGERGTFSPAGNCTLAAPKRTGCELQQHCR